MKKSEIKETIVDLIKFYKKFPPTDVVAEALNLSISETESIIKEFTNTGYLKQEEVYIEPTLNRKIIPFIPKTQKNKIKKKIIYKNQIEDLPLIIIRILMGVIGSGAAIMSTYYTSVWLFEFLPMFWAIFLASFMVLFSVLSFQIIVIFWERKNLFLIFIFALLWLIVGAFSIGSTVAGQYNQWVKTKIEKIESMKDTTTDQLIIENLKAQEKSILSTIVDKKRNRLSLQTLIEGFTLESRKEDSKYWNDIQWRIMAADKEIKDLDQSLMKIRDNIQKRLEVNPKIYVKERTIDIQDFYTFASGVLGISKDLTQFSLSMFPAVFIDIIAPMGIAVSLFLHKRKQTLISKL